MFAPTKVFRRWHVRVNQNQRRYATAAALAASALPSLVLARGHRVSEIDEIPLVVSSSIENSHKTKKAVAFLKAVHAYGDVEKVIDSKSLRSGKGKLRNRRFTQRRGPLVVYNQDEGIVKAFRNIPGVETCSVDRLNILQLAPGGHVGRFVIWTQDAFEKLDAIFGSTTTPSVVKKNYTLPQSMVTNPDLSRLINSDEIQSVVSPGGQAKMKRPFTQRKNPLRNIGVMIRFNPYAQTVRRREMLAQEARANGTAPAKAKKERVKNKAFISSLLG